MKKLESSSSLQSSFSYGDGERSTGPPQFVYITADKDFKKPALPGARCHAEIIEGKMHRKVGPCKVVSLSEASGKDGPWAAMLEHPSAALHMIYRKHPLLDHRYIGVKSFHEIILAEKCNEFCEIMRILGAKTINWVGTPPWVRNYESPGSHSTFIDPEKHPFLQHSAQWQAIVEERKTSWPDNISIDFFYDDHYSVTDEMINILLKKFSISPITFFAPDISCKSVAAAGSHRIFTAQSFPVQVLFFSRKDYEKINRDHICQHWGPEHVESLLRLWEMEIFIPLAEDRHVSIASLLGCKKEKEVEELLASTIKDRPHTNELFRRLSMLGELEDDHLIDEVESAANRLIEVHREAVAHKTAASSPKSDPKHAAAKGTQPTVPINPDEYVAVTSVDVSKLTCGDYNMAVIGCGGVGKTSIVKYLMNSASGAQATGEKPNFNFDEAEGPSVGPQLYECSIGHVHIECWDTAGQDSQRGGALLHTRRADILFVVYDVTSASSLNDLDSVIGSIVRNGLLPWATLCLIGNKIDLGEVNRKVSTETAIKFARKYRFSNFLETSAKTGLNVNVSLSNALLKCEQGKMQSNERRSMEGVIRVSDARRSVSSARESLDGGDDSKAGGSKSKCAC